MTSFFAVFVSTGCIANEETIPRAVSVMNNIRRVFRTLSNHRRYLGLAIDDSNLVPRVSHLNAPGVKTRDPGNEVATTVGEVVVQSSILRQFSKISCILWFTCLHYVSVRFVLCDDSG